MIEIDEVIARLRAADDTEVFEVIRRVADGRPGLAGLVAAAGPLPPAVAPPPVVAPPATPVVEYTDAGVPTFENVRDKVERRAGTAIGGQELAAETPAGRSAAQQWAERERAGHERLARIRAEMQQHESGTNEPKQGEQNR